VIVGRTIDAGDSGALLGRAIGGEGLARHSGKKLAQAVFGRGASADDRDEGAARVGRTTRDQARLCKSGAPSGVEEGAARARLRASDGRACCYQMRRSSEFRAV